MFPFWLLRNQAEILHLTIGGLNLQLRMQCIKAQVSQRLLGATVLRHIGHLTPAENQQLPSWSDGKASLQPATPISPMWCTFLECQKATQTGGSRRSSKADDSYMGGYYRSCSPQETLSSSRGRVYRSATRPHYWKSCIKSRRSHVKL